MYCNNCGKKVNAEGKFCQFCGTGLKKVNQESLPSTSSHTSTNVTKQEGKITLWDKFVKIYDSSGEERKKYTDLSSDEVWELIQRISVNSFESFIQDNKELLNKQPYKVIETLKNVFSWTASGGYWFWMAEALLEKTEQIIPKNIAFNHYLEEWKKMAFENYADSTKNMSDELTRAMSIFFEYELKNVLESADTVKNLPNDLIERLKAALLMQIIWGYLAGAAEKKYRK